jgi:hypothetical protein
MISTLIYIVYALAAAVSIAVAYGTFRALRAYGKFRGQRLVTCPENHKTAAVALDAHSAARQAVLGKPHFRLAECSRWPERRDCAQPCLGQIESDMEGSLVRNIVAQWYADKRCAYCGKTIVVAEEARAGHAPALVTATEPPVEWNELPPEKLPEMFQSHQPVCWSCQVTETFRRHFPQLVTDRASSKGRIRF